MSRNLKLRPAWSPLERLQTAPFSNFTPETGPNLSFLRNLLAGRDRGAGDPHARP